MIESIVHDTVVLRRFLAKVNRAVEDDPAGVYAKLCELRCQRKVKRQRHPWLFVCLEVITHCLQREASLYTTLSLLTTRRSGLFFTARG